MTVRKVAISLEEELYLKIQQAVADGAAPSFSAWMANAAEDRLRQRYLREFLDVTWAEHGPLSDIELAQAQQDFAEAPFAHELRAGSQPAVQ